MVTSVADLDELMGLTDSAKYTYIVLLNCYFFSRCRSIAVLVLVLVAEVLVVVVVGAVY